MKFPWKLQNCSKAEGLVKVILLKKGEQKEKQNKNIKRVASVRICSYIHPLHVSQSEMWHLGCWQPPLSAGNYIKEKGGMRRNLWNAFHLYGKTGKSFPPNGTVQRLERFPLVWKKKRWEFFDKWNSTGFSGFGTTTTYFCVVLGVLMVLQCFVVWWGKWFSDIPVILVKTRKEDYIWSCSFFTEKCPLGRTVPFFVPPEQLVFPCKRKVLMFFFIGRGVIFGKTKIFIEGRKKSWLSAWHV